jgi:DNA-binding transcriptional LysR family regulator
MDIRGLKAFVAIAETESFTRAGQRMEVSQSAISQQIRSLETSLGTALFARQARKVTLTQAGNVLLPYARQILAKVDEAAAVVSDFEAMGRGRVVIGAGGAICHHVLPQLLSDFSARFGKIEVRVISGFTSETLKRTLDGTVDVGLLVLPVDVDGIAVADLGRDELVAVAPPGHRWQSAERIRPKDFNGETLVLYSRASQTFRIVERFLLEAGVFPSFGMEISDLEAVENGGSGARGIGPRELDRASRGRGRRAHRAAARPVGPVSKLGADPQSQRDADGFAAKLRRHLPDAVPAADRLAAKRRSHRQTRPSGSVPRYSRMSTSAPRRRRSSKRRRPRLFCTCLRRPTIALRSRR